MKTLKLTIVIPVYNEENHIGACLDSIIGQLKTGDQIIVVDNASTDNTRAIVLGYDAVELISEPRAGRVNALVRGFDAAGGDIIARLNADVILENNWTERLRSDFGKNQALAAVTGLARTKILPALEWPTSSFWSWMYLINAEAYFGTVTCWGANMAISSETWALIRDGFSTCDVRAYHDDQDMSLRIAAKGLKIKRDNQLLVKTEEQSYYEWPKFREYVAMRWRTKHIYKENGSYNSPEFYRINLLGRLWRYAVSILPVSIFVISSLLSYPYFGLYRKLHG